MSTSVLYLEVISILEIYVSFQAGSNSIVGFLTFRIQSNAHKTSLSTIFFFSWQALFIKNEQLSNFRPLGAGNFARTCVGEFRVRDAGARIQVLDREGTAKAVILQDAVRVPVVCKVPKLGGSQDDWYESSSRCMCAMFWARYPRFSRIYSFTLCLALYVARYPAGI